MSSSENDDKLVEAMLKINEILEPYNFSQQEVASLGAAVLADAMWQAAGTNGWSVETMLAVGGRLYAEYVGRIAAEFEKMSGGPT